MKAIKVAAKCGLGFALLCSTFSLVFYFGDWPRLLFVSLIGLFVGLVAAPELEPKVFKHAWLFQLCSGAAAGLLLVITIHPSSEALVLAVILGGFLGWSAPIWAKHVPIP